METVDFGWMCRISPTNFMSMHKNIALSYFDYDTFSLYSTAEAIDNAVRSSEGDFGMLLNS